MFWVMGAIIGLSAVFVGTVWAICTISGWRARREQRRALDDLARRLWK